MKQALRRTTTADRLLFIFLIFLSAAGLFFSREAMSQGSDVVIEIDGKPVYTLPLFTDRTLALDGPFGPTIVEIRDRKVRVKEAHCPNQICVKQGWISRGAIVCLPNKLVVIVGGSPKDRKQGLDAITG